MHPGLDHSTGSLASGFRILLITPEGRFGALPEFADPQEDELEQAGASVVIYANHMLRSAYPAMQRVARSILEHGRAYECSEDCMAIKEILDLIPGTS